MSTIDKTKYYSIRQAAKLIPWINCVPSLQKLIDLDMEKNNSLLFKAIILKRNKQRRYYIKGEHIIDLIEKAKNNEIDSSFLIKNRK